MIDCQPVLQLLTGEATQEFTGAFRLGAVGHIKLAITKWTDRTPKWLGESS